MNFSPGSPLLSSKTDDWSTDPKVFRKIAQGFNFVLDVCADKDNAKCDDFFTVEDDALKQSWVARVAHAGFGQEGVGDLWMNPPYGRTIGLWIDKALSEATKVQIVCLLPARTDTLWWEKLTTTADEILFVTGRLRFGGASDVAPFASAIVVLNPAGLERKQPNVGWVKL